jgi:D-alanyl-D-alanine carboxypeptidase/D-alanyl-D-alanine-endopeptidase (penicillin-binding protein 4)
VAASRAPAREDRLVPHPLRDAVRPARWAATVAASAALALAGGLAPATSASAARVPLSPTDQVAHDKLERRSHAKRLGPDLAGVVVDVESGQRIWAHHRAERQIPASTVKLVTAVNALEAFGPAHRFTTRTMTGATPRRVVLVGGGDPSLSRGDLRQLARQTAAAVTAQGVDRVRVDVDDTLFPAPTSARGWRSSYTISDVSPVRALVVDQHRRWDTSMDAGRVFATLLERKGLPVKRVLRRARPEGSTEIARVVGDDVATQVTGMLQTSDNDVAEGLHRLVALQTGYPATWSGAAEAQVAGLARLGVTVAAGSLQDGSGLSRRDRLRPAEVAAVLRTAFDPDHPSLAGLRSGSLAVAGVSGTLGPRYLRYVTNPTRCAVGLIETKTGSLRGVIALSGLARGADGRLKAFSFLLIRVPSTLTTRRAVVKLATTVTGCW